MYSHYDDMIYQCSRKKKHYTEITTSFKVGHNQIIMYTVIAKQIWAVFCLILHPSQQFFSYVGMSLPLSKDQCVLLKNTLQWPCWGSNPQPLSLRSSTLSLSHSAPWMRSNAYLSSSDLFDQGECQMSIKGLTNDASNLWLIMAQENGCNVTKSE